MRLRTALLAASGATLAVAALATRRREALARARRSLATSSAPSAGSYESVFDRLLGSFYELAAADAAGLIGGLREPVVLEIGPGPGGLALRLAARLANARITGIDVDPAMVARAQARADAAGLAERVRFEVGDVAALPHPDATFDLVLSTLSVHHWAEAARGFAEIRRVLRPGGRLLAYDLPDGWGRLEAGASPLAAAAAAGGFGGAAATVVRWPWRVPLLRRLEARLDDGQDSKLFVSVG